MADEIKVGPLLRDLSTVDLTVSQRDDKLTRLQFSASSETPVERFFGKEILSHDEGAVDMQRFQRGAVPLLFNHSWDDPIGMVDSGAVRGGRLMVDAHLFATQRAKEVQQMIDGGLRNVSVGYQIHEMEEVNRGEFKATRWGPLEVSLVTVPADSSVGINRSKEKEVNVRITRAAVQPAAVAASTGVSHMADEKTAVAGDQSASKPVADVRVTEDFDATKRDQKRTETIRNMAGACRITDGDTIRHWILSGKDYGVIANEMNEIQISRAKSTEQQNALGLTPSETKRFSIVRAVRAIVDNNWREAGFEAECSRTIAQRLGKSLNGNSIMVPVEVQHRTLIAGTATQGGYAVATDNLAGSFIDLLRNRSVAFRLGAREMMGLQGNVTIPKQATGGAVAWIGETGTATANELTLGQISMSPKHVAGYQQISRQLLLQSSPDAEMLVNSDLAAALALGLDAAVLAGTSTDSSQPLGIRYTSGLGTANPTSGTAVTYGDMIRFQSTVASSNALFDGGAYVCHPAIAAVVMGKPRFTNSDTPIWGGNLLDGEMVGRRAMSSLQVTSGTMLYGDFSQVIIGSWSSLEVEVNPYAVFQSGIIGVRGIWSVDVAVRYGSAFAIGTGITG